MKDIRNLNIFDKVRNIFSWASNVIKAERLIFQDVFGKESILMNLYKQFLLVVL